MSLFAELKRRNVIRMGGLYLVGAWLVVQVAETILPTFAVPVWVLRALIVALAVGFVPALVIAWVFELTPEGLRREVEAGPANPLAPRTARRIDRLIVVGLLLVIGLMAAERFWLADPAGAKRADPGPVATRGSIAVLPFTNRGTEADAAYFVDGVHDDLLTQLARNGALKVISRTSVMEYRDTKKNLRQIGRELGVAAVLEGAVQRAGNRVRINAQLIDTATDEHLWAETFDRELTPENIFEIQTGIAQAIAAALAQTLGDAATTTVTAPTRDREAYDLYLQARALDYDALFSTAPYERAAELYRKAIARDPEFALAMGGLGHQLTNIYWFGSRGVSQRDEGRQWIDRALALAPDEPWLHWILADHLYHGHLDYEGALRELEIAERGLPNGARIFLLRAWILRRSGDLAAALRAFEAAVELDPRSDLTIFEIIYTHEFRGDLAAVRLWGERLKAIPSASIEFLAEAPWAELALAGDTGPIREFIGRHPGERDVALPIRIAYLERRYDDAAAAIAALSEPLLVSVRRVLPPELLHAFVLKAQGRPGPMRERAAAALVKLDAFLQAHPDDARATSSRGMALAMLGRAEEARGAARSAVRHASSQRDALLAPSMAANELTTLAISASSETVAGAMASYLALEFKPEYFDYLMLDPVFDPHREHPAFRALAQRYSRKASSP